MHHKHLAHIYNIHCTIVYTRRASHRRLAKSLVVRESVHNLISAEHQCSRWSWNLILSYHIHRKPNQRRRARRHHYCRDHVIPLFIDAHTYLARGAEHTCTHTHTCIHTCARANKFVLQSWRDVRRAKSHLPREPRCADVCADGQSLLVLVVEHALYVYIDYWIFSIIFANIHAMLFKQTHTPHRTACRARCWLRRFSRRAQSSRTVARKCAMYLSHARRVY